MRTINLTNSKKRDAEVCMETMKKAETTKRVTETGDELINVKILKQNLALSFETLRENYTDTVRMGQDIIQSDPEIDMEIIGKKLSSTRKLYVQQNGQIAYRVNMVQVIKDPQGNEKERKDLTKAMSNITGDSVVQWTGKKFPKDATIRKFVFARKMQIKHVSGLTYDFLYGMAKELHDSDSLMFMGGGKKGNEPLVLTQGGEPYRGFLEGRVDGEKYCLILHLTNMEIKVVSA